MIPKIIKVEPIETESKQDVRLSTKEAFPEESQIYQEDVSFIHYFSWLSDVFLSVGAIAFWAIIPNHNIIEEPSYW